MNNELPSVGTDHTPGRLYVRGGFSLYAEDKKTPVADACLNAATHDEGNARRLAACWNALENVPTEAIEGALIHGRALMELASERDALAGRVAELDANARRYEWLRENNAYSIHDRLFADCPMHKFNDAMLDAAIDAALNASKEQP